ncbi:MAG TPA: hypothetical protein VKR55_27400 [Bradyrhizobium sp.]|nr:hypothetical protein [Bradyrhizobium sp.]HLZ05864.1 hypothetical protein [Bradyrhizobium sp.]
MRYVRLAGNIALLIAILPVLIVGFAWIGISEHFEKRRIRKKQRAS